MRHRCTTAMSIAASILITSANGALTQTATGSLVCKPVTQRSSEEGCYILVNDKVGKLPDGPIYWHIYKFPNRSIAEGFKRERGTLVDAYGSAWVMTIEREGWRSSEGER